MQRTIKLKITTTRKRAINLARSALCAFCEDCNREVQTLTRAEATQFLEISEQLLAELIAASKVHVIRTVSGSLRVCQDSLSEGTR